MSLQFDSRPLSQNRPSCSVTTTQNSSEYENRNGTGYTLEMLHNRKSQRCIRWLFLMNTRAGTVLTFRGNGTGSWCHNRVARAIIEPMILWLMSSVAISCPRSWTHFCWFDSGPLLETTAINFFAFPCDNMPRYDAIVSIAGSPVRTRNIRRFVTVRSTR